MSFLPRLPQRTVPATLLVLLLASCTTNQQPIRVVEYTSTTESNEQLEERIARLEQAEDRLSAQYEAMGQTLTWLRGEIKALRAHHRIQYKPLPQQEIPQTTALKSSDLEIAPPQSSRNPQPPTRQPHQSADAAQTSPGSNEIAPLSEADLDITPQKDLSSTDSHSAQPISQETVYLVHLASYRSSAPLQQGWQSLSQKTPEALANTTPYATSFQDSKGLEWVRLSAGPFTTRADAQQKCQEVKSEGGWCDIIKASDGTTSSLNKS